MKTTLLKLSAFVLLFALMGAGCEKETDEQYVIIKDQTAKVFKSLKSLDNLNQPKDYNWAISTNNEYLNRTETPIDENILVPENFPDEFKIDGLIITISGKKYLKYNRELTSPDFRTGFGYLFEITEIKKAN